MNFYKISSWGVGAAFSAVVAMVLVVTGCVDTGSKQHIPVWAHEVSDLPVHPGVVYGQLDNGMRYALMQNDTPSNQAVLRMQIAVGSLYEEEDQRGIAHFIEHMAFNGTTNVPEGEMIKILERRGLAFGADTNASTGYDYTTYMLNLPETDEDTIDTSLFIMRETASEILFGPGAIERERGVVQSEKRTRQSPNSDAREAYGKFIIPHALTNMRDPIGTDEVLVNAKRDRFVDLYEKYYTPKRTIIVMVGDFDVAAVEQKIRARFSDWQNPTNPGADPDRGYIEERGLIAGTFQHKDIGTSISMGIMRSPTTVQDSRTKRKRELPHWIASSIVNQRLGMRSREKDAPFYGGRVSFSIGDATGTSLADSASARVSSPPEKWREALGVIEQEVRRALQYGFTQAEVTEQIVNMRSGAENTLRQEGTVRSGSYAGGILGSYNAEGVYTQAEFNLELFNAGVATITPETVLAAFQEQWQGGEPRLFLATSEKVTEEELIAVYKASQATPVSPPKQVEEVEFAYTGFGPTGKVVWRDEVEDFGITRVRFDNNVMVNIKQTAWEKSRVRVSLRLSGGNFAKADGLNGLESVLSSTFISGGLEAHDIDALRRIMVGRNVGLGFGAGAENFGFSGSTIPKDFLLQLQLWAAYLQHPAWRPEGLDRMHASLARRYETKDSSVRSVSGWKLPSLLHSGDPRWDRPREEELRALTIDQARAWVEEPFANGAIEIAVVGDIDPEVALAAIAKTFGALPKREAKFRDYPQKRVAPKFPHANEAPHTLHHGGGEKPGSGPDLLANDGRDGCAHKPYCKPA